MARTLLLRYLGRKSILDSPKVRQAVADGTIDADDVWADEARRITAMPFVDQRVMGPTNVYGVPNNEGLERTYSWGPDPHEFVQEVPYDDAIRILRGASGKQFRVIQGMTLHEAQITVARELTEPLAEQKLEGVIVPMRMQDALNQDPGTLMKAVENTNARRRALGDPGA